MSDAQPWPTGFRMLSCVPDGADHTTPVIVAVHDTQRNAYQMLERFALAGDDRLAVLTPVFDEPAYHGYEVLGFRSAGTRADLMLEAALDWCGPRLGLNLQRFHLFGFGAGAQFAHRFAMLYPQRVRTLHVASAGWYTFPDPDAPWPRGIGRSMLTRRIKRNLPSFLALQKEIYVGAAERDNDPALQSGRAIDRQQGTDRVERAWRWAGAVGEMSPHRRRPERVTELPAPGHDFDACCNTRDGSLVHIVIDRVLAAQRGHASGLNRNTAARLENVG